MNTPGNTNENFQLRWWRQTSSATIKYEDALGMNTETLANFFIFFLQLPFSGTIYFLFHYYYIIEYQLASSLFIFLLL